MKSKRNIKRRRSKTGAVGNKCEAIAAECEKLNAVEPTARVLIPEPPRRARVSDVLRNVRSSGAELEAETSNEIRARTGVGVNKLYTLLHQYQEEGKLRVVRVLRPNISGVRTSVAAYYLEEGGERC